MKYLAHILSILVLVIGFSSCQKIETEGFEAAETSLQNKSLEYKEDPNSEGGKPSLVYRDEVSEEDDENDGHITDDEDDEDEDENNPSAKK